MMFFYPDTVDMSELDMVKSTRHETAFGMGGLIRKEASADVGGRSGVGSGHSESRTARILPPDQAISASAISPEHWWLI